MRAHVTAVLAGRDTLFTQDERAVFDHGELGDDTPSGAEAPPGFEPGMEVLQT